MSLKLSVGVIFREKSLNILSHRCILEVCVNFAKGITLRDSALCIIQVWHKYQKLGLTSGLAGSELHVTGYVSLPLETSVSSSAK